MIDEIILGGKIQRKVGVGLRDKGPQLGCGDGGRGRA